MKIAKRIMLIIGWLAIAAVLVIVFAGLDVNRNITLALDIGGPVIILINTIIDFARQPDLGSIP